jgi:hypothetical protein
MSPAGVGGQAPWHLQVSAIPASKAPFARKVKGEKAYDFDRIMAFEGQCSEESLDGRMVSLVIEYHGMRLAAFVMSLAVRQKITG